MKYENDPAEHWLEERYGVIEVIGYADSSYITNLEDEKTITEYYFFFGKAIVTW